MKENDRDLKQPSLAPQQDDAFDIDAMFDAKSSLFDQPARADKPKQLPVQENTAPDILTDDEIDNLLDLKPVRQSLHRQAQQDINQCEIPSVDDTIDEFGDEEYQHPVNETEQTAAIPANDNPKPVPRQYTGPVATAAVTPAVQTDNNESSLFSWEPPASTGFDSKELELDEDLAEPVIEHAEQPASEHAPLEDNDADAFDLGTSAKPQQQDDTDIANEQETPETATEQEPARTQVTPVAPKEEDLQGFDLSKMFSADASPTIEQSSANKPPALPSPTGFTPGTTLTMAELYEAQHLYFEALEIYLDLYAEKPDDELRQRIDTVYDKIFTYHKKDYDQTIASVFTQDELRRFLIMPASEYRRMKEILGQEASEKPFAHLHPTGAEPVLNANLTLGQLFAMLAQKAGGEKRLADLTLGEFNRMINQKDEE